MIVSKPVIFRAKVNTDIKEGKMINAGVSFNRAISVGWVPATQCCWENAESKDWCLWNRSTYQEELAESKDAVRNLKAFCLCWNPLMVHPSLSREFYFLKICVLPACNSKILYDSRKHKNGVYFKDPLVGWDALWSMFSRVPFAIAGLLPFPTLNIFWWTWFLHTCWMPICVVYAPHTACMPLYMLCACVSMNSGLSWPHFPSNWNDRD